MGMAVGKLFERYEAVFNRCLSGDDAMDEVVSLYAAEVIGAAPGGVRAAKNDEMFRQALAQGYEFSRTIGTKGMRIRAVRLSPIDEHHCMASVSWTATYGRPDLAELSIDFDVHYFVQTLDGEPKVFGWVSGDEQALLRTHGVL